MLLLLTAKLSAATLYVATTGTDSRTYAQAQNPLTPWLTITNAAALVQAGDTVNVAAGTYAENVTLTRSGTQAAPIKWVGAANHTTIIDPSTDSSSGWVEHVATGVGVYRKAMATAPGLLTANGYTVMQCIDQYGLLRLNNPTDHTQYSGNFAGQVRFWNGLEALWVHTNSYIYIRFRDRSDANTKNIRVSGVRPVDDQQGPGSAPLKITASYNHVTGFKITGGFHGVVITGTAVGNVIDGNFVTHGYTQVLIFNPGASSNAIVNNVMTPRMWSETAGVTGGAWAWNTPSTDSDYNVYSWGKDFWSGSAIEAMMVNLYRVGASNLVSGNVFSNGVSAVNLTGLSTGPFQHTVVRSNVMRNLSAQAAYVNMVDETRVHDNVIHNVNIPFRPQSINATRTGDYRLYVYRNRVWNPPGRGEFTYFHGDNNVNATFHPTIWYYHNSYEGGFAGIIISQHVANRLSKVRFVNNIFSTVAPMHSSSVQYTAGLGAVDFNLVNVLSGSGWYQTHNEINKRPYEWGGATASATPPDFLLTSGSQAISKGLPVHQTFTLNSASYSALPGFTEVYYSGTSADIGAVPYGFVSAVTNVLSISTGAPFNVLLDADPDLPNNVAPLFYVSRAPRLVDGALVPNTVGDCPFTVSVSSPDGAVEDVDYTVFQTSGQIDDGSSAKGSFVVVKSLRNPAYTGQRRVRVTIEPGDAYGLSGTTYADVILYDADLPPGTLNRPQPQPGHGMLTPSL